MKIKKNYNSCKFVNKTLKYRKTIYKFVTFTQKFIIKRK